MQVIIYTLWTRIKHEDAVNNDKDKTNI